MKRLIILFKPTQILDTYLSRYKLGAQIWRTIVHLQNLACSCSATWWTSGFYGNQNFSWCGPSSCCLPIPSFPSLYPTRLWNDHFKKSFAYLYHCLLKPVTFCIFFFFLLVCQNPNKLLSGQLSGVFSMEIYLS